MGADVKNAIQNDDLLKRGGVELLKTIAMFLIVVHHMTNSIWKDVHYIPYNDFVVDLTHVTTNIQQLFLSIFAYTGMFGNSIFFLCSAWFLLDKEKGDIRKCTHILADVWLISILMLGVSVAVRGNIDFKLLIKELFPNLFENNWYATCYIIFMFLYPVLNSVIYRMNQVELLRTSLFLCVVYIFAGFIKSSSFFSSPIIIWVAIYFSTAYFKFYMPAICDSRKVNGLLLAGSIGANVILVTVTNILGLKIELLSDKLLYWNSNCSPFLLIAAFAAFNLFRNLRFKCGTVRKVSRMTLLIYLFHENLLFRNYFRPFLWKFVYDQFGYQYVIVWLILLSMMVYIVAIIVSLIYSNTIQNIARKVIDRLYLNILPLYLKIELKLLNH